MNYLPSPLQATLFVLAGVLLFGFTPSRADTILINFGPNVVTQPGVTWNNISSTGTGSYSLQDVGGTGAGTFSVLTPFAGSGNSGTTSSIAGYSWPSGSTGATSDYLYTAQGGGTMAFTLSGLDTSGNTTYTFTFLSSRTGPAGFSGDIRQITLTFGDAAPAVTQALIDNGGDYTTYPANTTPLVVAGVHESDGTIGIISTANYYSYFNVLEIDTATVPEPSTIALAVLGGFGLFVMALRRRQAIQP